MTQDYRKSILDRMSRNGFELKAVVNKWGTFTETLPYSPQWNIRQGNAPKSMEECITATLEALILEGGIEAWDGDGVCCVAQMVWAQHQRAEKAEAELTKQKNNLK